MTELIGWIGGLLFALCGVPQAWACWKQKHSDGLSWAFLLTWLVGEVLTLWFVLVTSKQPQLVTNYFCNLSCLFVILFYKISPRVK